jgi:hypothetical protein
MPFRPWVSKPLEIKVDPFLESVAELGYSEIQKEQIFKELAQHGLWSCNSSHTLVSLTKDLIVNDNPTTVSTILIQDFGFSSLTAHQTRAALTHMLKRNSYMGNNELQTLEYTPITDDVNALVRGNRTQPGTSSDYKSTIINKRAKSRAESIEPLAYGLPNNYRDLFPQAAEELEEFFLFMTKPTTDSQNEVPIRKATADIYMRHAKLFLGWFWYIHLPDHLNEINGIVASDRSSLTLLRVFPTKEKESAESILAFLTWLRSRRKISVSYEANLLRGLLKLVKFRFRKESNPTSTSKSSFEDIPIVGELRKWHRDVNKRQNTAPRVVSEKAKWISWPEYLEVVQLAKSELLQLIDDYMANEETYSRRRRKTLVDQFCIFNIQQRRIALAYQKYLILAIFANVPDRQRTIRELQIHSTLVKDVNDQWCIKHAPEDYKTGKTYGERPSLPFPIGLSSEIDDFIQNWRPCFCAERNNTYLFVQPRTGKPLTSDSVYHSVARTCYHYTGKRTNPHLLRDMIVTHVRESSAASEQQLEALALFMGHSVNVQRKSYDRRTLTKKVEPAVALLKQVNNPLQG